MNNIRSIIILINVFLLIPLNYLAFTSCPHTLTSPIIILNQKLNRLSDFDTFIYSPDGKINFYIWVILYLLFMYYSSCI